MLLQVSASFLRLQEFKTATQANLKHWKDDRKQKLVMTEKIPVVAVFKFWQGKDLQRQNTYPSFISSLSKRLSTQGIILLACSK